MAETDFGKAAKRPRVRTAKSVTYGDVSSIIQFEITRGNCKVAITQPSDGNGDITVTYTLTNPRETTSSIQFLYSTDGGTTYVQGTSAGGDSGVNSLASSTAGTSHTFAWDSVTDVGIDHVGDIYVKIKAYDLANQGGDYMEAIPMKFTLDNAPLAPTIVFPTAAYFDKDGTLSFRFEIPDPVSGNSDMHAKIEFDRVNTFNSANLKVFESRNDQVGWQYDSDGGGTWVNVPNDGIPIVATPALIGNEARFTPAPADLLIIANYYHRVRFGGVL